MKRLFIAFMAIAALSLLWSCGDDDPSIPDHPHKVQDTVVNHIVNASTGEALAPTQGSFTFEFSTGATTGDLTLNVTVGGTTKTISLPKSGLAYDDYTGRYTITANGNGVTGFTGLLDINEWNYEFHYTFALDGNTYRVTATSPSIYYFGANTLLRYADGTQREDTGTVYRFDINPTNKTATIIIYDVFDTQPVNPSDRVEHMVESITAENVPFTLTAKGYVITGEQIATKAEWTYQHTEVDKDKHTVVKTVKGAADAYPMTDVSFLLNVQNSTIEASGKLGNIQFNASGTTYPSHP